MKIDPKETISKTTSFVHEKAAEAADAASSSAKKAHETATEAAKRASIAFEANQKNMKLAHYKPVFPEEYLAPDYDRPKMIIIEDEDTRKGIDVCEGAIGWFGKAADLEVLHLYEEAVPMSGVDFYPQPVCGAAYFENKVTASRYINLDSYFDVLEKDRLTELRRIAYDLGARRCTLESYEEAKAVRVAKAGAGERLKGVALRKHETLLREDGVEEEISKKGKQKPVRENVLNEDSIHAELDYSRAREKSIVFTQTFEGNAEPKRPKLEWFKNDREIEFLIDTRCNGDTGNKTKTYRVQLDSSSTQTMSISLAAKVDKALGKLGAVCNFSIEGEAKNEARKKLVFEVEF